MAVCIRMSPRRNAFRVSRHLRSFGLRVRLAFVVIIYVFVLPALICF